MATIHPNQTARDLAKEVGAERAWSIAKGLAESCPFAFERDYWSKVAQAIGDASNVVEGA